jgi:hypothetical protein
VRALPTSHLPRSLGWQTVAGQAVIDTYRQIRSVISAHLGDAHCDVLAVPIRDVGSAQIDWYLADNAGSGPISRLIDLSPDARDAVEKRLEHSLDAIATLGRALTGSLNASEARMGERLLKACRHPGPECVFVVDDRPVIAGWGTSRASVDQTNPELTRSIKSQLPRQYPLSAQDMLGSLPVSEPPLPPASSVAKLLSLETFSRALSRIGGRQGEVNVLLQWRSPADLDLSVVCPGAERISYSNRRAGGGELDVDMNFGDHHSDMPAENIYFPPRAAKPGRYLVLVRNSSVGYGAVPFEVIVAVRGEEKHLAGEAASGQGDVRVFSFLID